MKRVLIFSLTYIPHVGGAEVAIKEITDRLSGVEFHMLTMNFGNEKAQERVGNVTVHRLGSGSSYLAKILFVPRAARAARRLHAERHFDALWAMMSYMSFPIVLARLPLPYVLTLQEGDPFEHVFNRPHILPFKFLLRRGFRGAAKVTAISTFLARWATQVGFSGAPELIPNGVDIKRFGEIRAHPGAEDVRLVTTSRLVHKNAVDDVIRALVLLPTHVRFVVYGSGPDEAKLKTLARKLGVENRVDFMGHLDHARLPLALAACDIFIRPSRSEGMGISFVEAMAAGLPVIATQEGGISDFLFDAKRNPGVPATGWAVDKDSPEQIAAAVQSILENPHDAVRVAANARKFVSEHYGWDGIALRMERVFEDVIMRIVVATPLYPPEIGGPATYVRELEQGLPAHGINLVIVKFSEVRMWPRILRHYMYYRRVLAALRGAHAVLALDPVSVGYPAFIAAKRLKKPFIVKIVGDYAWEQGVQRFGVTQSLDAFVRTPQRNPLIKALQLIQTRVANGAKQIIVPSSYLKDIVSQWRVGEEKIFVIHNGVSLPRRVPPAQLKKRGFLIVSAGRRVPWKGFETIERIAEKHAADGWEARIVSELPRAEALGWVEAADVFVLNSRYEGFPHALIEAMMLGTPVIATDAKFHRELLSDGESGLLVPVGDSDALERALLDVWKNPGAARKRAQAAVKRMETFSLPHMLQSTERFLKRVI